MEKFVTLVRFQFPHEAFVIKSKLESEDIEVYLKDEQLIQVHNYLSNAIGGIKLQVKESDIHRALPLLKEAGLLKPTDVTNETRLQKWIVRVLDNSPLFKKLSRVPKFILHLLIFGLLLTFLFFIFTLPTKEEKSFAQEQHEKFIAEWKFYQEYLPYADSLVEYDPVGAVAYIQELNKSYPENEYLTRKLGIAFFELDSIESALKCFELTIEYSRFEYPIDHYNIAMCKVKLEDYEGAIENLKIAAQDNHGYWYDLAYVYELNGDLEKAEYFYSIHLNQLEVKFGDYYFEVESKLNEIRKLIKNQQK